MVEGVRRFVSRLMGRPPECVIDFHHVRRQRFAVPLGDGRVLCHVLGRYRMFVDADDRDITPHLIMDGAWEENVSRAVLERLGPGMVAVDVGANVGYFSLLMAMRCGPGGHVVAIEPNPRAREMLHENVRMNGLSGQVTVHDSPASEEDGREVILAVSGHQPGGAQLTAIPGPGMTTHALTTRRLDGIPRALDATLVKIDTEGHEDAVWRGMGAMIAGPRLRTVIIEFTRQSYRDAAAFLAEMVAAGFALSRIEEDATIVATNPAEILAGALFQMLLLER